MYNLNSRRRVSRQKSIGMEEIYIRVFSNSRKNDWLIKKTKFNDLRKIENICFKASVWYQKNIDNMIREFYRVVDKEKIRRFHGKGKIVFCNYYGEINYSFSNYIPKNKNMEFFDSRRIGKDEKDKGPLREDLIDLYDSIVVRRQKLFTYMNMCKKIIDEAIINRLQDKTNYSEYIQIPNTGILKINKRTYILIITNRNLEVIHPNGIENMNDLLRIRKT